jgi:hypothetical protein
MKIVRPGFYFRRNIMAKRVRRVRPTKSSKKNGASDTPKLSPEEQFRQEYAYVIKDLRQVLVLAVLMFALLIVLNVVLR